MTGKICLECYYCTRKGNGIGICKALSNKTVNLNSGACFLFKRKDNEDFVESYRSNGDEHQSSKNENRFERGNFEIVLDK